MVNEFSYAELPSSNVINLKSYIVVDDNKIDYRLFPKRIQQDFEGAQLFSSWSIMSTGERPRQMDPIKYFGEIIYPAKGKCWSHTSLPTQSGLNGMQRLLVANRLVKLTSSIRFKRYLDDFPYKEISNWWDGFGGIQSNICGADE